MSLTQLQEVAPRNLILLVGPPGAGKSTFCHQAVLRNIETRPVIYVSTESGPSKVMDSLREVGLGEVLPHELGFIDAFNETVGLQGEEGPDTLSASCQDLTGLSIAISRLRDRIGEESLLVFDSLTSPYMFNGPEILRFTRLTISRFAAEGNSVLACIDEGCGREEDIISMMSAADGIVKIELMNGSKTFNIVKHPRVKPTRIEVSMTWSPAISYQFDMETWMQHYEMTMGLGGGTPMRAEVGDYVNLFWPNLARWSGMLWDPKRFPTMTYNLNKHTESNIREFIKLLPWRARLYLKFMPKDFSKVKDMKKFMSFIMSGSEEGDRHSIGEYLESVSKTDEHYFREYEDAVCWGFENVGASLHLGILGVVAGVLRGFERDRGGLDRDWNGVETKCVGLGDPYCEVKFVPGEIDELKDSLESLDSTIIERIHGRLMDRLMDFVLHGGPLWERPRLGSDVSLHMFSHMIGHDAAIASGRYRMAMRLGGAMGGKEVGEHLMDAGIREDEAVQHVLNLLEHCKVGKVSMDETIRISENCESFGMRSDEPSCFFTTGFLNGFFSAVKNQHVKETKCIAVGDPFCEWEFR